MITETPEPANKEEEEEAKDVLRPKKPIGGMGMLPNMGNILNEMQTKRFSQVQVKGWIISVDIFVTQKVIYIVVSWFSQLYILVTSTDVTLILFVSSTHLLERKNW